VARASRLRVQPGRLHHNRSDGFFPERTSRFSRQHLPWVPTLRFCARTTRSCRGVMIAKPSRTARPVDTNTSPSGGVRVKPAFRASFPKTQNSKLRTV